MFPIFTLLGGTDEALDLIARKRGGKRRAGAPVSRLTIAKWRRRGLLPGPVQTICADECAARGISFSYEDMRWQRLPD